MIKLCRILFSLLVFILLYEELRSQVLISDFEYPFTLDLIESNNNLFCRTGHINVLPSDIPKFWEYSDCKFKPAFKNHFDKNLINFTSVGGDYYLLRRIKEEGSVHMISEIIKYSENSNTSHVVYDIHSIYARITWIFSIGDRLFFTQSNVDGSYFYYEVDFVSGKIRKLSIGDQFVFGHLEKEKDYLLFNNYNEFFYIDPLSKQNDQRYKFDEFVILSRPVKSGNGLFVTANEFHDFEENTNQLIKLDIESGNKQVLYESFDKKSIVKLFQNEDFIIFKTDSVYSFDLKTNEITKLIDPKDGQHSYNVIQDDNHIVISQTIMFSNEIVDIYIYNKELELIENFNLEDFPLPFSFQLLNGYLIYPYDDKIISFNLETKEKITLADASSSARLLYLNEYHEPNRIIYNNSMYYSDWNPPFGMYKCDGTYIDTISNGEQISQPNNFFIYNDKLFFTAMDWDKAQVFVLDEDYIACPPIALAINNLFAYPNPTNSEVNLVFSKDVTGVLRIYDINGILIDQLVKQDFSNQMNFEISNVGQGMYFLSFVSDINSENFSGKVYKY